VSPEHVDLSFAQNGLNDYFAKAEVIKIRSRPSPSLARAECFKKLKIVSLFHGYEVNTPTVMLSARVRSLIIS
jgi:hypothetical protein